MYEALSNRITKTIVSIFLMYCRNLHYMRFYCNFIIFFKYFKNFIFFVIILSKTKWSRIENLYKI